MVFTGELARQGAVRKEVAGHEAYSKRCATTVPN